MIFPNCVNVEALLTYENMIEPVDVDPIDRVEMGEENDEWSNDLMNDLERRFNKLRQFNATMEESPDKDVGGHYPLET